MVSNSYIGILLLGMNNSAKTIISFKNQKAMYAVLKYQDRWQRG